jgi:hypothetical protein
VIHQIFGRTLFNSSTSVAGLYLPWQLTGPIVYN